MTYIRASVWSQLDIDQEIMQSSKGSRQDIEGLDTPRCRASRWRDGDMASDMAYELRLPDFGEDGATVSYWRIEEGEHVDQDEDLVELSTDTVIFKVPSPVSGTIVEIRVEGGETIEVGALMAIIEPD